MPSDVSNVKRFRVDTAVMIALACLAAVASAVYSSRIPSLLYEYSHGQITTTDVWFDADIPNRFEISGSRFAGQYVGTSEHPLLPVVYYLPVTVLASVGLAKETALRLLTAAAAASWTALLYLLLRSMRCRMLDASVFTLLGVVSASAVFWFAVPELFLFGSVTILAAACLVAIGSHDKTAGWIYTLVGCMTLGVTVTNWMAGLFAAFLRLPWRTALQVAVNAFVIVSLIWIVEAAFFPDAVFFLEGRRYELDAFVEVPRPTRLLQVMRSFAIHSMVMPDIQVVTHAPFKQVMTVQAALPGSASAWGATAVFAWLGLLAIGTVELVRTSGNRPIAYFLGLSVFGQLLLHSFFGHETFLYSMHFLPLLVAVTAFGTLGQWRTWILVCAGVFILAAGVNNVGQFQRAIAIATALGQ